MFSALLAQEFGDDYEDLRDALPSNPTGRHGPFSTRPLSQVKFLAVHHTAGNKARTWADIARDHILPKSKGGRIEAAGLGYHICIRNGVVSLAGDLETSRANVARQNHVVIGIVIAGDYTREPLADDDRDALQRVVRVLDAFLGRALPVVGHGQVPGGPATACPGRAVLDVLPGIRQAPAPSVTEMMFAFHQRLRADAPSREVLALNPAAGLTRAILADRYVPVSREYDAVADDGTGFTCQLAQTIRAGRVVRRIYMARRPDWSIRYIDV